MVDPDRVGTFGWSNGSILSIELGVADPDRYKVVSAGAGDVEWISDWANVDFGESFDTYYFGKSPLEDPQLYLRISPLYKLDRVKAPTIIFFGTEDRNVPTSQGWIHYRALYHLGKVPVKFILFPGEPHGLQEYAHQMRKLDEEMAWLDTHFFKTLAAANEAFKKDSPLGQALRRKGIARVGTKYGVAAKTGGALVPEAVTRGALEVGRFEVTRAQYAAFDPAYAVAPGTENFPANGVPFEKAKAYAAWLAKLTGQAWRLPTEEEATALAEGVARREHARLLGRIRPQPGRRPAARGEGQGARRRRAAPQGSRELRRRRQGRRGACSSTSAATSPNGPWPRTGAARPSAGAPTGRRTPRPGPAQASAEYTGFRVVRDAGK